MVPSSDARVTAAVSGRVQGVGFRAFVMDTAQSLGLTGWVRNTYRGEVEVLAEGPRPTLERLIQLLEIGPRSARVIKVDAHWDNASGEFDEFFIAFDR